MQYYGRHRLAHAQRVRTSWTLCWTWRRDLTRICWSLTGSALFSWQESGPKERGIRKRAIYLLERGIVANPEYWRLWEDLGFIYYWDMKDYRARGQGISDRKRAARALAMDARAGGLGGGARR